MRIDAATLVNGVTLDYNVDLQTTLDGYVHLVENFIDATSANQTVALPAGATVPNKMYIIHKTDSSSYTVTVTPNGSELINGETSQVLDEQGDSMSLIFYSGGWYIV